MGWHAVEIYQSITNEKNEICNEKNKICNPIKLVQNLFLSVKNKIKWPDEKKYL